jgi:hypothetical protein
MARATRYDAAAGSQAYISRMIVAFNSVSNTIGIERRAGTFQDFCDLDVGYMTILSYNTVSNKIVFTSSLPATVQAGDVVWARLNASPTNAFYRAPITAVSTTTLPGDTITVSQLGIIPALSGWPSSGSCVAIIMSQIANAVTYQPTVISDGFSSTHMSDVSWILGDNGWVTDTQLQFTTDMHSSISTLTSAGFAPYSWPQVESGQAHSNSMSKLVGFNSQIPQDAQRAAVIFVQIANNHAWEPFTLAGFQVSTYGEAKIRRGTGH